MEMAEIEAPVEPPPPHDEEEDAQGDEEDGAALGAQLNLLPSSEGRDTNEHKEDLSSDGEDA